MLRTERNDDIRDDSGWTRYQQLVLSELERHEQKLDLLEKEIVDLRLANQKLEHEIATNTSTVTKLLTKIESLEAHLSAKIEVLNQNREQVNSEVKLLKWKVGGAAGVIATVATVLFQLAVKYFLHI